MEKISGIYHIINKINGKYYIGSSINLHTRKLVHFNHLRQNKHHNIYLQRAFNKQNENDFEFVVIEYCTNTKEREQNILNELDLTKCYNVSLSASGGDLISNHPNREEIIKKSTENLKKCKKRSSPIGNKNPNWKGGRTFCKCGNRVNSGAKCCIKCLDRNGVNNPFYGKKHTEELKKIKKEQRTGKYSGNQEKKVIVYGKEYKSLSEASRQVGVPTPTVLFRIRSKHFTEYKYK